MGRPSSGPDAVRLPLPAGSRPWQRLTGATLRCTAARSLLADPAGADLHEWCLVLVGWDGERLPVAALPLPGGPTATPSAEEVVLPVLDVPLTALRAAVAAPDDVRALHLETSTSLGGSARLWATLAGGELQSWALLGVEEPQSLGRWRPSLRLREEEEAEDGRARSSRDGVPAASVVAGWARPASRATQVTAACVVAAPGSSSSSSLLLAAHGPRSGPKLFRVALPELAA